MAIFMTEAAGDHVVARYAAGPAAASCAARAVRSAGHRRLGGDDEEAGGERGPGTRLRPGARGRARPCVVPGAAAVDSDIVVAVLAFYAEAPDAFNDDHLRLLDLLAPRLARSLAGAAAEEEKSPDDAPEMSRSATIMFRNGSIAHPATTEEFRHDLRSNRRWLSLPGPYRSPGDFFPRADFVAIPLHPSTLSWRALRRPKLVQPLLFHACNTVLSLTRATASTDNQKRLQ